MEKQNIEELIERNAVGNPKCITFTVKGAFAWHPKMTFTTPTQGSRTQFFSDAISVALFEYRHAHKEPIGNRLRVTLKVSTKNGDEHIYTVKLHSIDVWRVEDIEKFGKDIVSPNSLLLVHQVKKDIKFDDVAQVTAYVYETNEDDNA